MKILANNYYLDNFNYLIEFVSQHYQDILSTDEKSFLLAFACLSQDAQRLYVRLISRRGPAFRVDKLNYDDIKNIQNAVEILSNASFVKTICEIENLISLLTVKELKQHFSNQIDFNKSAKRPELLGVILSHLKAIEVPETPQIQVVELLGTDFVTTFKLLFFGNFYQDLDEFILNDLDIYKFEKYPLDPNARYFNSRVMVDDMLHWHRLNSECDSIIESGEIHSLIIFSITLLDFIKQQAQQCKAKKTLSNLARRIDKLINKTARQLERNNASDEALSLFELSNLAPARERQIRILTKLNRIDEAMKRCEHIFEAPQNEAEMEFAQDFSRRLINKYKFVGKSEPKQYKDEFLTTYITVQNNQRDSVEELACCWYITQGDEAFYVENTLITALFGLYFWDIIFMPIKGVFFNPFQLGPSDLFTSEFRNRRSAEITYLLNKMDNDHFFKQAIIDNYTKKLGTTNYFVHWQNINLQLLHMTLSRIPASDIKLIFNRILQNIRENCSGLPDLLVFPQAGQYLFSEVKGPGDHLQKNQKRWFRFFQSNQIPATVLHVAY